MSTARHQPGTASDSGPPSAGPSLISVPSTGAQLLRLRFSSTEASTVSAPAWHGELIPDQPRPPGSPVPALDQVQPVEEGRNVSEARSAGWRAPEACRVDGARGQRGQQRQRHGRYLQRRALAVGQALVGRRQVCQAGVIGAVHDAAAKPGAGRGGVDPGHGVLSGGAGQQAECRVEIRRAIRHHAQHAALDRQQADRRAQDDPGQAHAADSGPQALRVGGRGQRAKAAGPVDQLDLVDPGGETPVRGVIACRARRPRSRRRRSRAPIPAAPAG